MLPEASLIICSAGPKSYIAAADHDDRQLPVQGVVVEQRGIHQTVVPVAGKSVPGTVQGIAVVHGSFHHHQRPVPERIHRRAKRVSPHDPKTLSGLNQLPFICLVKVDRVPQSIQVRNKSVPV